MIFSVIIVGVHKSDSLRCYSGSVSSGSSFDSESASIIEECGGRCHKVLFEDSIDRGCSETVHGANVCDAARTITTCYCGSDLCNAGSTLGVTLTLISVTLGALKLLL